MASRRIGSIRPRGANTFQLVVPGPAGPDGRRRQRTRTFHGTAREAEKELARFLVEVAGEEAVQSSTATVAQLLDEWMALAVEDMSPSTAGDFRWYIETHIKPRVGHHQVARFEGQHLERLYDELRKSGGRCRLGPGRKCTTMPCPHGGGGPLAAGTVKRVHTILHAALEQACRWHWLPRNPADDVKRSKRVRVKRAKPIPADSSDVARLTRWLQGHDPEFWCFVVLASRRGARPGEICALRWSDIDLDGEQITFARNIARAPGQTPAWVEKETKQGDERTIALRGVAHGAVAAHRRASAARALQLGQGLPADGRLFHHGSEQRPWQPGNISRRLRRAVAAAEVGPVTFRALRHYVATTLVKRGEDPRLVAGVLGHARPSTTLDIYADWVPAKDRDAALLLDEELDAVDAG